MVVSFIRHMVVRDVADNLNKYDGDEITDSSTCSQSVRGAGASSV